MTFGASVVRGPQDHLSRVSLSSKSLSRNAGLEISAEELEIESNNKRKKPIHVQRISVSLANQTNMSLSATQ